MMRKTRTKTPYQVDVLTIILVTALVLFGLVTVLNVFCDPFDGSEKELSDYMEKIAKEELGYVGEGERIFINVAGDQ